MHHVVGVALNQKICYNNLTLNNGGNMFGGYVGQDEDKQKIKDLKAELEKNPNSLEVRQQLENAKKYYQERMDSALRSYSRL